MWCELFLTTGESFYGEVTDGNTQFINMRCKKSSEVNCIDKNLTINSSSIKFSILEKQKENDNAKS